MKVYKSNNASQPPMVSLEAEEGTVYKIGQALKIVDGKATPTTDKPTYISVENVIGKSGEQLAAIRVSDEYEYKAALTAKGTALKIGDKVTIASDCVSVTATITSGICEITGFETDQKNIGDNIMFRL